MTASNEWDPLQPLELRESGMRVSFNGFPITFFRWRKQFILKIWCSPFFLFVCEKMLFRWNGILVTSTIRTFKLVVFPRKIRTCTSWEARFQILKCIVSPIFRSRSLRYEWKMVVSNVNIHRIQWFLWKQAL